MINLGNVAGVVRSDNPPLEADNVTEKRYVLWARPIQGSATDFDVLYYASNIPGWISFRTFLENLEALSQNTNTIIGDLNDLNTTNKTSIVQAINSLAGSVGSFIEDVNVSTSTGYSSNKIEQSFTQLRDDILGNVSANFNTLEKIEQEINNALAASTNSIRYDQAQSLSNTQQEQARNNISALGTDDIGDITEDLVAYINTI